MSEPRPVEVSTGSRARMVVAVVIRQARTRRLPASHDQFPDFRFFMRGMLSEKL